MGAILQQAILSKGKIPGILNGLINCFEDSKKVAVRVICDSGTLIAEDIAGPKEPLAGKLAS